MRTSRNIYRFAALFSLAAFAGGCGDSPSTPLHPEAADVTLIGETLRVVGETVPVVTTVTEQTIGPEGGTLHVDGGHSLHFPAGALPAPTTITAVRDPLQILVDFGPEGLVFPDNARPTLTFSYEGADLLGLADASRLAIVYLEGGELVEVLSTTLDPDAGVARAELEHFSTYALATD